MSVYTVSLTTLSPLHIGDGLELRKDFDFVTDNKQTYRLNEDAILERKANQLRPYRQGQYRTPGQLLDKRDYQDPSLFRYVLRGSIHSNKPDARLKSFIKDVYDRPYIPGSSLKGAIRTALGYMALKDLKLEKHIDPDQGVFGNDPNSDLMRVLQFSDLFSQENINQCLEIVNAYVYSKKEKGSPISLESIRKGSIFSGTMKVDTFLYKKETKQKKIWIKDMLSRITAYSNERIALEEEWISFDQVSAYYNYLNKVDQNEASVLLQIGWGGGWNSKTYSTYIKMNENLSSKVEKNYKLKKNQLEKFPLSRRLAVLKDMNNVSYAPFGWVLLEVKPK